METITLNRKEQQRIIVLNRVESRELTAAQAGELMGLSVRQVRRLLAAYRREGVVAIATAIVAAGPRIRSVRLFVSG